MCLSIFSPNPFPIQLCESDKEEYDFASAAILFYHDPSKNNIGPLSMLCFERSYETISFAKEKLSTQVKKSCSIESEERAIFGNDIIALYD